MRQVRLGLNYLHLLGFPDGSNFDISIFLIAFPGVTGTHMSEDRVYSWMGCQTIAGPHVSILPKLACQPVSLTLHI